MKKTKSITNFVCQECGYESIQFLGKCPECGAWNSLKEFKTQSSSRLTRHTDSQTDIKPLKLSEVHYEEKQRIKSDISELDRVLGGGIVQGSVTLLSGDPGIGKSTLLLQVGMLLSAKLTVLYISAEESEEQIKLRAQRVVGKQAFSENFYVMSLTDVDRAQEEIIRMKPQLVIVDSVQTMESQNLEGLAGSVGQVRYTAFAFLKTAKTLSIPVILVGHVTKEGMVAGPMILSHMVDTVLFLEGEKTTDTRILRSFKNRFGPIDEVGVFVMQEEGMKELKNPESLFITNNKNNIPGSVVVGALEGTRAFLVEVQALVVSTKLPVPRRVVSGVERSRVELLLAVLQKHVRLPMDSMDVFVNVAGGLKLTDRAADLGVCLALFSSLKNISLQSVVGIAEVGLQGELRPVPFLEKRIKQAEQLGYKHIMSPNTYKYLDQVIKKLNK